MGAETQGDFLRNQQNYAKGSFQYQALAKKPVALFSLPQQPAQAVRVVAQQFTPQQAAANVAGGVARAGKAGQGVVDWITQRALDAKNYFFRRGWSAKASAAIAGHLVTESAMQTQIRGDGGYSVGIAQWNGQRFYNLQRFAAGRGESWQDFETQLAFIEHELQTSETVARDALKNSKNIVEATAAFMHFERPLGYSPYAPANGHGWSSRLHHAQRLYALYHSELASAHP